MAKPTGLNKTFNIFNGIFMGLVGITCILPLFHVLAVSVSNNVAVTAHQVTFWPVGFNLHAYEKSFSSGGFLTALQVGIVRTVLGSVLSMFLTVLAAYPLSKQDKEFKGRTAYAWFFVFTILFNGGLIPSYLAVKYTGLIDSILALILPVAVNVFNTVVLMNFFRGIPKELEEAAHMDGAGYVRILFGIYLPISLAPLATLSLFTLVFHWNSWFDGMIYMNRAEKYPLATFLRFLVASFDFTKIGLNPTDLKFLSERALKSAQIFIGILPILLVYPFLQRYFIQGMTLGSVKE